MAERALRVLGAFALLLCHGIDGKGEKVVATVQNPFAQTPTDGQAASYVYEGEDAAAAAQRVAEEHGVFEAEAILEIAKVYKEQLQAHKDFTSPKDLVLRTGGAYIRRAEEAIKEKRFAAAAADCMRALMRPGLDPTATEPMMKKLEHALLRMQRIKEMKEQEEEAEKGKYAAQEQEADTLAKEWTVLLSEDETMWRQVDDWNATRTSSVQADARGDRKEVASVEVQLQHGEGRKQSIALKVHEGEDASHAAFHFCVANGIRSAVEVEKVGNLLMQEVKKQKYQVPEHLAVKSAAEHLERGQSHLLEFELSHAGIQYARGLHSPDLTEEVKEDLSTRLSDVLTGYNASQLFISALQNKDYQAAIDAIKDLPTALRSDMVHLLIARAYNHRGKVKEAMGSLTSLLNKCDKSGEWLVSEPRLIAAAVGAQLALRVGDIDKAKKMYQMVLRNDPEQPYIKKRYKVLRSFMKILSDIEELLEKSKNHDAVKAVSRTLGVLERVLGKEGAVNAGTRLLLFECKAKSAMTFHDDAIEACNTAIQQFENHDNPDPRRIAEAYAWRAEANKRDNSFDDAVADLQVALTKNPNSMEYQERLQEAKHEQDEWNKSEDQRDRRGESLGNFYVNRPIKQMLDLPDNIDELDKETRCKWLKSSFRKMSLRWHPDKAKGGKRRAQRKSAEIGEGKGLLELQWGCKGRRR